MRFKFFLFLVSFQYGLIAQNPIPIQVSYPVFFEDVPYPHLQSPNLKPIGELCGIALLYLDTLKDQKEIIIAGKKDPVIWLDKVGISTKLSLIMPDTAGNLYSLDFLYSNNICAVSISRNDSIISIGNLRKVKNEYAIRIIGSVFWEQEIDHLFQNLNNYLLRLHTRKTNRIPVSGIYNPDSINIILGHDYSFDTNFDLSWFDEGLRNRIKTEASAAYRSFRSGLPTLAYTDTIRSNSFVVHTAKKNSDFSLKGKVATIFKMEGGSNYLFLRKEKEYLMEIEYSYELKSQTNEKFSIDKLVIKNMENGDFLEMSVFDLTDSSVPILYVDLISGVVMEDGGAWRADQFITAIQDVFRLVKLPGEG